MRWGDEITVEFVGHGGDDVGRTLLGMRPHQHDVAVRRIHADRLHPRCGTFL